MKVQSFAVTVQWGEGMHYFQEYCSEEYKGRALVLQLQKRLDAQRAAKKNKGAKPKVMLWERVET